MKGKYAARATLRREDEDVRSQIESYQRSVKRLTAEVRALKDKLATVSREYRAESRRLRLELQEGISPELLALRKEVQRHRERADKAEADARETRRKWGNASKGMQKFIEESTGAPKVEAFDILIRLIDPELDLGTIAGAGTMPEAARRELGTEACQLIDRSRNYTHPRDPSNLRYLG